MLGTQAILINWLKMPALTLTLAEHFYTLQSFVQGKLTDFWDLGKQARENLLKWHSQLVLANFATVSYLS